MNGIILEDSDGRRQSDPTETQILATLERIGDSLDHCILHLSDGGFLQTAGEQNRLLLQYADEGEILESAKSDFDAAQVSKIFMTAISGNEGWKQEFVFRNSGGTNAPGTNGGESAGSSLKDQLFGTVKREISREASRGIGNLMRKGIRSFTGRR